MLREPGARVVVVEDDGVLARLEHHVEVAARDRLLRPPAVDDAPLLAHDRDALPIDAARQAAGTALDERVMRAVETTCGQTELSVVARYEQCPRLGYA